MLKTIAHSRTYKGQTIWFNNMPGSRLRWTSNGLAADTLDGIKSLIRKYPFGRA